MPELPEVEALKDFLTEHLVGHEIVRVLPVAISVLKTYDPPLTALEGHEVVAVHRHGKFLDVETDGGPHFVTHLARAGWLHWKDRLPDGPPRPGKGPARAPRGPGDRRGLRPHGGGHAEAPRGVRRRRPAGGPGCRPPRARPLADDFDEQAFADLLRDERRQLKGALRDQTLIAGVGNAYSDEILHAAKMSPFKLAASLTPAETHTLYTALRTTLNEAIERSRGVAAGRLKAEKKSGLRVHGRTGEPCPVCGDTIREVSFSDSSLQYCPTCQTGGKPLADRRMSKLLK